MRVWQATSKSVKILVIGGLLLAVLVGLPIVSLSTGIGMNNAECWRCGHRFHVSEEYRDSKSRYEVTIACPKCGTVSAADTLYQRYGHSLWDQTKRKGPDPLVNRPAASAR